MMPKILEGSWIDGHSKLSSGRFKKDETNESVG